MCQQNDNTGCGHTAHTDNAHGGHFHRLFSDVHAGFRSQFEDVAESVPDDLSVGECRQALSQSDNYDYLMNLGGALSFQLRYKEAAEVYENAVKINPDDVSAHRRLALCYLKLLRFDEAIAKFRLCEAQSGANLDLLYRIGLCLFYSCRYTQAAEYFERCYPLCADDGDMYIAVIYWHLLSLVRAKSDLSPALSKYHRDIKIGHHVGYLLTAEIFCDEKNVDTVAEQTRDGDEMTHTIMLYGAYHFALYNGEDEKAKKYLAEMLSYDTYWASFAWIAAYVDGKKLNLL